MGSCARRPPPTLAKVPLAIAGFSSVSHIEVECQPARYSYCSSSAFVNISWSTQRTESNVHDGRLIAFPLTLTIASVVTISRVAWTGSFKLE